MRNILEFSLVYKGPELANSSQFYSLPFIITRQGVEVGGEDGGSDNSLDQSGGWAVKENKARGP